MRSHIGFYRHLSDPESWRRVPAISQKKSRFESNLASLPAVRRHHKGLTCRGFLYYAACANTFVRRPVQSAVSRFWIARLRQLNFCGCFSKLVQARKTLAPGKATLFSVMQAPLAIIQVILLVAQSPQFYGYWSKNGS
jgi:hypothetical protein